MNRDNNRMCKQCGTTLPQTRIWCPQCGTANPVGNVLCDNCNARLVTAKEGLPSTPVPEEEVSAGVKGISLPTVPIAEDGTPEPAELPDWLVELTEEATGQPTGASTDDELAEAELPDWLSGLMDEGLGSTEDAPAGATQGELPSAELPDWLSDFGALATGAVDEAFPADVTPEVIPDAADAEDVAPAELPDWGSGLVEAQPELDTATEAVEPEAELPDWMADFAESEVVEPSTEPAMEETASSPDWLSGMMDEVADGTEEEETPSASPDWLSSLPEVEVGASEVTPELPDWLSTDSDQSPVSEEQSPRELPSWLAATADETLSVDEAGASGPELAAAEVPDWLSGAFVEDTVPVPAKTETPSEEEELPDWLADAVTDEVEPVTPSQTPFETTADEEAFPDWLTESADSSPAFEGEAAVQEEAESLPEWLSGLDEVTESASAVFAEAGPEEVPAEEDLAKADLPAWLQDVPTVPDETAPKPAAPAFVSEDVADEDDLLGGDVALEEGALEEGTMPEWLQELEPASEEQSPLEEGIIGDDEGLARAEVPAWVQNLRPPGTGPLPALSETAGAVPGAFAEEAGGLARAEIPDWLQQLRPSPTAEGGVPADGGVLVEPVEVEGPLSGLSGVLPAGLAVDMPTDYKGAPQPVIPEPIVAQAQLWQELLEQPRSVERPVAQQRRRSGAGETATRLTVGLVLVVVTVLGLWLGGPRWSQALRKPHVESLSAAIDALQPGDRVVIAVEYGSAEAGEMTPIAKALLGHLADKQVEVVAISTLPDGSGLAQSLLTSVSVPNQLPEGRSSYLSGASNGIALFLGESMDNVDMLLVLSARAERLRWWVELNNASTPGVGDGSQPIPMGIGVSASVGPLVSPYLGSPQVEGWLVGLPDVVAYREFRGLTSDFFNSTLDALMFAHWAALGLMILGFIYYLASGKKGSV